MSRDESFEQELAGLVARSHVPLVDVDPAGVVVTGRRVRRRRAVGGSTLAVAALAGVVVAAPFGPHAWGPAEPTPTVTATPSPTASAQNAAQQACLDAVDAWKHWPEHPENAPRYGPDGEQLPPVVEDDVFDASNRLGALVNRYADVTGDITVMHEGNGDVYEVDVVEGSARADAFEAAVRALDLSIQVRFVPAAMSREQINAVAQSLFPSEAWAPGLTMYGVGGYPRPGCLVIDVDPDQLDAWRDHLAHVNVGAPVVAVPGGPVVLQPQPNLDAGRTGVN